MPDSDKTVHAWGLPDVTTEEMLERDYAMGYSPASPQPESEEEEALKPGMLTAADLEEIRQAAYQEGLEQGKEDGFAKGYQEGLDKGQEDGLAQGKAQGRQEGLAQGQAEIDALAERWQAQLQALSAPLRELDELVEQQLIQLTAQLAKAVVRTELKSNNKVLLASLREAVALLNVSEGAVRIALAPDDLQMVKNQYGEQVLTERNWHLLAEPELQPGQLQVEHHISHVDVDLHERLEATIDRFLAQLAQPSQAGAEEDSAADSAVTTPPSSGAAATESTNDEPQPED